jgi:hypothetical protein
MLRSCFAQLPYSKTTIFSTKLNLGEMAHVILAQNVSNQLMPEFKEADQDSMSNNYW